MQPDCGRAVQVAQIALPLFLSRCRSMLQAHAAAITLHSEASKPGQLDDFMCMLEVLQLMNLPPAVADAAISPGSSLQVLPRPLPEHGPNSNTMAQQACSGPCIEAGARLLVLSAAYDQLELR